MLIDIGGGTKPLPGFVNLDPVHGDPGFRRRAQDVPWPVRQWEVEEIHASHVMEHIPAGADRIAVMNEAWRVLRPGGRFRIIVPLFPTWAAIADPTHVSYWVKQSFDYFDGSWGADADYGIELWETIDYTVREGWEATWTGRKPI